MPETTPTTNEKPQTPATATATVETRDASGIVTGRQKLRVESEFGNTPQGVMANIWAKLGMLAAVTIFFAGAMLWMMSAVNSQVDLLRDELKEARLAAAAERKDMVDRYIASREDRRKEHQEVLSKLDKQTLTIDHLLEWYFKERLKAPGERIPPPKMDTN